MRRGKELTWKRAFLIACVCQLLFVLEWLFGSANDGYGRHEAEWKLLLMYFVVPLVAAIIWRSWKVFLIAVAVPFALVLGETLYFLF